MSIKQLTISLDSTIKFALLFIGFFALHVASTAQAKDYMVEVLVFENVNSALSTESHDYEAPQNMKSGSQTWLLEPTMLIAEAELIQDSDSYELKQHYSWGIESLPYEDSANYTILEEDAQGYIKVYADQLLFTNLDLDYKGFRMKEKRRLKLNEKHFFDHPKFGLLMQVSRLPETLIEDGLLEPGSKTVNPLDLGQ